ncbi:hypothetical protein ACLOJK_036359, partial [Asimina triloba]
MYTGIRYTTGAPKSGAPSSPRATHGTHRRRAANRQIQADQNDGNDELSSSPSPSIVISHHQTVHAVDSKGSNLHQHATDLHQQLRQPLRSASQQIWAATRSRPKPKSSVHPSGSKGAAHQIASSSDSH